ncbi:DUF4743 domain-containing protein [Chitinivorax sp. PXF-14]|uniref:NUDIX hydrolase n=1 Tax=Chitinivorax sp. PXF-14 TaxID=3230488 RepID=UPI003465B8E5
MVDTTHLIKYFSDRLCLEPIGCLPLSLDGARVGWVSPAFAAALRAFPATFACSPSGVAFAATGAGLTDAMAAVCESLCGDGWFPGWRGERFAFTPRGGGRPLFDMERGAFRRFGLMSCAVHLNGYADGGDAMWVARRSDSKAVDPGRWDNLAGGGVTAGEQPRRTLLREAEEESGVPASLSAQARYLGQCRVCRAVDDGFHDECLYLYDLDLPAGFAPVGRDGEVAEHALLGIEQVLAQIVADRFTVDAALVIVWSLLQRGVWPAPLAAELHAMLRRLTESSA